MTVFLLQVSHERVTETVSRVLYVPEYSTATHSTTLYQPVLVTTHLTTTDTSAYGFTSTTLQTVLVTVTQPVTFTHKSGVLVPTTLYVTSTAVEYRTATVTHAKYSYLHNDDVVFLTNNIVEFKPSYETTTTYYTQYVTTTHIERVPEYVTKTVEPDCGTVNYFYAAPDQPFHYGTPDVDVRSDGSEETTDGADAGGATIVQASGVFVGTRDGGDDGGDHVGTTKAAVRSNKQHHLPN